MTRANTLPPLPNATEITRWDDDVYGNSNGQRALSAKVVDERTLVLSEHLWNGLSDEWELVKAYQIDAAAFERLIATARSGGLRSTKP